jgi:transketolase
MALAARLDNKDYHTYVLLGDGECDEGQVWEAAMFAPNYRLDNLTAIVDFNTLQLDGFTREIMNLEPFMAKWAAFRWEVIEINGHDIQQIIDAIARAKSVKGKPTVIIAHTVKGKGVSFMENNVDWHGKAPNKAETEIALRELS